MKKEKQQKLQLKDLKPGSRFCFPDTELTPNNPLFVWEFVKVEGKKIICVAVKPDAIAGQTASSKPSERVKLVDSQTKLSTFPPENI